jgi:DNA-directed RNA polymerase subunit M/transcription elongation factor TFIIS
MNPLLENAVVSIQLGLEDFATENDRRIISAARNLYSGVLLLCKEVLRRLSPPDSNDVLIRVRKKVLKDSNGRIQHVGDGNKTIDRAEIEDTFKQLKLAVDLSKLKRLAEIRNDIEHLHPKHAPALIHEAIADAMPIIRDVVVNELHEEPAALLGQNAWGALLDEARVFKAEQDACHATFNGISWESDALADAVRDFQCPNCSSTLLRNDKDDATAPDEMVLVCSKCGEPAERDAVIEAALEESLAWDCHRAAKEGDEQPLDECPECLRKTYVLHENQCRNPDCGFSLEGYTCALCEEQLTLDDYRYGDGGLCGYHAHVTSKDD